MKKLFPLLILSILFLLSGFQFTYAHDISTPHTHNIVIDTGGEEDTVPDPNVTTGSGDSITLNNPLENGGIDNIPDLVNAILDIVLTVGVPIIVVAIIYSGFKFIAAQGNPEKLKEAKQTLLYVLIGAAILLAAWAIAQAIFSTIVAIRG